MASIVDSLVAPLSVINALIVALCMKKQNEVAKTLTTLEEIWDEYQVYDNDEIDLIDDSIKNGAKDFHGKHIQIGSAAFPTWNDVLQYISEQENIQL
jgi:hypothetical protein